MLGERTVMQSGLALLELGLAGSAVTYVLFFHFIRLWGSTATSINTYFQPFVGISLSVWVLGESIDAAGWFALSLILTGIVLFGIGSVRASTAKAQRTQRLQSKIP